jgi:hypothetical protein
MGEMRQWETALLQEVADMARCIIEQEVEK